MEVWVLFSRFVVGNLDVPPLAAFIQLVTCPQDANVFLIGAERERRATQYTKHGKCREFNN